MIRVGWIDDPELEYSAVVIEHEKSGDTIEVQRAHHFDDEDRALGMDTYCIVRGGATIYGGLTAYSFTPRALRISLTDDAASVLDLDPSFDVDMDADSLAVLRARLPGLVE
jgi:hypothetical protein